MSKNTNGRPDSTAVLTPPAAAYEVQFEGDTVDKLQFIVQAFQFPLNVPLFRGDRVVMEVTAEVAAIEHKIDGQGSGTSPLKRAHKLLVSEAKVLSYPTPEERDDE